MTSKLSVRTFQSTPLSLLASALLLTAAPAVAQQGDRAAHASAPVARAVALQGPVTLDGRLDEAAWRTASPVSGFKQIDPNEGQPVSERTEVYIAYDAEALYVAARLHDGGPVSRRLVRRDAVVNDSDWFSVALDSYHDHLTAFRFWVNPEGVRRDELLTSGGSRSSGAAGGAGGGAGTGGGAAGSSFLERGGQADASWEPIWAAAAAVTDSGWTAEMRIPFSQLRYGREQAQTWGLQLERRIARKQEQAFFAFTPKNQPAGVALFGHLEGIQTRAAQKRLEIAPYAFGRLFYRSLVPQSTAVAFGNPFQQKSELSGGVGTDLKYRLTSNFTLDATLNPDFGQVELDPAVVNLTAFETRFEEKRPFFVEGAEILRFGTAVQGNPEGGPPQLVYSRRIGRAPQLAVPRGAVYSDAPETTTILGAAKLTGRTGKGWSVGLLQAVTQHEEAVYIDPTQQQGTAVVEPLANYLAARLRRDVNGGRATFGALATAVNRRLDAATELSALRSAAYSGGVDFRKETSDRVWSLFGTLSASHIRGSTAAISAAQRASARYLQRPDADYLDFDPAATSMSGYRAQVDAGKRAGAWIWNTAVTATSPGYEINDIGFQLNSDRILLDPNISYERNRPGGLFRRWSARFGPDFDLNYGGNLVRAISMLNLQGQLLNYWTPSVRLNYVAPVMSDRLTRGGPLARLPSGWVAGASLSSDPRQRYTLNGGFTRTWDAAKMRQTQANLSLGFKPASNWDIQIGPNLSTTYLPAQYVTTVVDATATGTFGSRYVFAGLDQTTLGIDTRVNVTFTPSLSLEMYAQPFFSSNDFGPLKELRAPRTYDFLQYGTDVGTTTREAGARDLIDPDGAGPARPFRVDDRDFNLNSLRGNAVLRWEWRPGSTMFLVWQQDRAGRLGATDAELQGRDFGSFDVRQNLDDLWATRPVNVLVFKVSYWLNP
jgi:hypothetical protein